MIERAKNWENVKMTETETSEPSAEPPVLNNFNCIKLLESCVENGLIQRDPANKNNILVYYDASKDGTFKEGWYSCNLLSQAGDLCRDGEAQRFLITELAKKGVEFKRQTSVFLNSADYLKDYEKE